MRSFRMFRRCAGVGVAFLDLPASRHRGTEAAVHVACAVRKGDGRFGIGRKEVPVRSGETVEHCIGRRHRRQSHVQAIRGAGCDQPVSEHQRRFRLAAARLVLDHEQGRPRRERYVLCPSLHRARLRPSADQIAISELSAGGKPAARLPPAPRAMPAVVRNSNMPPCLEPDRHRETTPDWSRSSPPTRQGPPRRRCALGVPQIRRWNVPWRSEHVICRPDEPVCGVDPCRPKSPPRRVIMRSRPSVSGGDPWWPVTAEINGRHARLRTPSESMNASAPTSNRRSPPAPWS